MYSLFLYDACGHGDRVETSLTIERLLSTIARYEQKGTHYLKASVFNNNDYTESNPLGLCLSHSFNQEVSQC